ncbi:hypothetical protein VNO78_14722 [Psophocarpus tetragonolobus]|uniref:Protein RDM1 n=1 Tax=Psophocarpus tetragonolobus TaxID=3891 RepID=A0AAN9XIZ5_PSOTE
MLRRNHSATYKHILVSDSDTESDDSLNNVAVATDDQLATTFKSKQTLHPDALVELAKEYQKQMKKKAIPKYRINEVVVVNWKGLAKSMKRLYGQPLHYLTHKLCKEWDKSRFGSKDEEKPLNAIYDNWRDAEDTVWKVEEVHRLCTSPLHLAMLWLHDPEYHIIINEVISPPSSSIK